MYNEDNLNNGVEVVENSLNPESGEQKPTRTFTQEDLDRIIRERINKQNEAFNKKLIENQNELLKKFNVNSVEELESFVNNQKSLAKEVKELKENQLLTKFQIKEDYIDDVKLILTGKGLEINEENIKSAIEKRPEWVNNAIVETQPIGTTIQSIGNPANIKEEMTDEEYAEKLFGVKFIKY